LGEAFVRSAVFVGLAAAVLLPTQSLASDFRLIDAKSGVATVVDLASIGADTLNTRTVALYDALLSPISPPGRHEKVVFAVWRYLMDCSRRQWRLVEMSSFDENFTVVDELLPQATPWRSAQPSDLEPDAHFALYCSSNPASDARSKRIAGSTWQAALLTAQAALRGQPARP
jgi:hypothetical protein